MLSMSLNIVIPTNQVQAATGANAFPESYRAALQALQNQHSNWTFTPYNTGLSWSEFMAGETGTHFRNSVHSSSATPWKCTCGANKRWICVCFKWNNSTLCRS